MSRHTPGPWRWRGNTSGGKFLHLESAGVPLRQIVMTFTRWGMSSALPQFNEDGILARADEYFVFPKAHHAWEVDGLTHPDARLIAKAPDLYAAAEGILLTHAAYRSEAGECQCACDACEAFRPILEALS